MSADDMRLLKSLAEGDGVMRMGKRLVRSLIEQAEAGGAADPAPVSADRNGRSRQ